MLLFSYLIVFYDIHFSCIRIRNRYISECYSQYALLNYFWKVQYAIQECLKSQFHQLQSTSNYPSAMPWTHLHESGVAVAHFDGLLQFFIPKTSNYLSSCLITNHYQLKLDINYQQNITIYFLNPYSIHRFMENHKDSLILIV